MAPDRQRVLGGLFLAMAALTAYVLAAVLQVVVFAITVAYVLYPLRRWLADHGLSRFLSSLLATAVAFVTVLAVIAPILIVIYQRRWALIEKLQEIPEEIPLSIGGLEHTFETEPIIDAFENWLLDVGVQLAVTAPRLFLEFVLFAIVVFGILYRPLAIRNASYGMVPREYHDVLTRLHEQTKRTVYSIYVIQLATAGATFAIAFGMFLLLGYEAPFSLAVIAGILQFVPIVGPSILVVGLALNDIVVLGTPYRGGALLLLGLLFISLFPDAVIRPRLATHTGQISSVLYFIGFVGGILTLGAIGLIVGPLVVALLAEVVRLVSEGELAESLPVDDTTEIAADGGPPDGPE